MKKLVSLMMIVVMLCSACAMADGYGMELKDIMLVQDQALLLDLSGIGIGLDVFEADENSGLRLRVEAADKTALELAVGLTEEAALLKMSGVSDVYSIAMELVEEMLPEEAVSAVALGDVSEIIKPEDQLAVMMLAGKAAAVFSAGVTVAEDQDIEGVVYDVTTIDVPAEEIKPLLDELVVILEPYSYLLAEQGIESITAAYNELNPVVSVAGEIYENDESIVLSVILGGGVNGQELGALYVCFEGAELAEDSYEAYAELGVMTGESDTFLAVSMSAEPDDGSWIPAADAETVDLAAALQDEALSQKLMAQVTAAAMSAVADLAAANETVAGLISMFTSAQQMQ